MTRKFRQLSSLGFLAFSFVATAVLASQTALAATSTGYQCEIATSSACASLPAGGSAFSGETITSVAESGGAWRWDRVDVGTVNSTFPFTNASLATKYAGHDVVIFHLHDDTSFCMANSGTQVLLRSCSGMEPDDFVLSGGFTVSAAASDNHSTPTNAVRYVMTNDGGTIIDALAGSFSSAEQNWQFNVPE